MGSQDESALRNPATSSMDITPAGRTVPIIQTTVQSATPSPSDRMDMTSPAIPTMGPPPARTSPDRGANGTLEQMGGMGEQQNQNGNLLGPGAATGGQGGVQQPKVQQTAFIHKLYKCVHIVRNHNCNWADHCLVCSRIQPYHILFRGRIPTRASSCLHPTIFRKCFRMF